MTFCLGIRVSEGLVGLADTLVMTGHECITARKVTVYENERQSLFVMTSGLRAVRDKVLTYFNELMEERDEPFDRLFKAVNAFAEQLRRVAQEDKPYLVDSGLPFDLHTLIGGQLANDRQPHLYLVYPQGNWVETAEGTPYSMIGTSSYGKPILDRALRYEDTLGFALKVGCLAFDSTRISAANVDYPLDVVLFQRGSDHMITHRFEKDDLAEVATWWQDRLRSSIREIRADWVESLIEKLTAGRGLAATPATGPPDGAP